MKYRVGRRKKRNKSVRTTTLDIVESITAAPVSAATFTIVGVNFGCIDIKTTIIIIVGAITAAIIINFIIIVIIFVVEIDGSHTIHFVPSSRHRDEPNDI